MTPENVIFPKLEPPFSGCSLFQPNFDSKQHSRDVAAFLSFVCRFFDVGAIQNPIEHLCCSGGSEPHFKNVFSENPFKNAFKTEVVSRTGLRIKRRLRQRFLFTLFSKLPRKHKKDILMTLFL